MLLVWGGLLSVGSGLSRGRSMFFFGGKGVRGGMWFGI